MSNKLYKESSVLRKKQARKADSLSNSKKSSFFSNNNESKKSQNILWFIKNIIPMLLIPIMILYLLELYTHNPWTDIKPAIQGLNIALFEIIMLVLFFITGSLKIALRIETIFFMIAGLANYFVLSFRSAPIMPWDIYSIKTAASVANNYKYTIEANIVYILLVFVFLIVIEAVVSLNLKSRLKTRCLGLVVSIALLCGFTSMMHQPATITRFGIYDKLFTPTVVSKRTGTALAFVMELQYISVDKPAGYSSKNARQLLSSYENPSAVDAAKSSDVKKPNIIVIMNEAFSDPSILGDFETNEDYMPFIHSLMEEGNPDTISGYLNVSVLGGNTANTEFEFLTGDTMAFLPQGSVAYQQFVKKEKTSLASHLRELGYETIAMHPYNSTGWDRNTVYPNLGFNTSYFIKDWKNPEKVRKYVSDKSDYDKIIEQYEKKPSGQPMFLFNVTMQNHSSYSDEYDNFHPDITVKGTKSKILPNYLSLLKLSDKAVEYLIDYFTWVDEDTIIVFFGDHQTTNSVMEPIWKLNGKSSTTLTEADQNLRYKVPFFIWANFNITEENQVETSANFLGIKTLEAAGLPLTDYQSFLKELSSQYPVITAIRAENSEGISSDVKNVADDLHNYASLQYYHLFN